MARVADRLRHAFVRRPPPPRQCPLCRMQILPSEERVTIADRVYHEDCAKRFGSRFRVD
jgi:hypothetical protein